MTTTILASFPSPSQGVWHLGPIPIRAYAMFILLGVIAALFIGNKRWVDRGGERGVIFDIALWAIIFGLIGGRLYHVLTDWSTYFGSGGAGLVAAFKIQEGGLGIWGAVALGGVGAWIGCRRKGIPLPAFGDAIAPGIVLAQAIGRIGNYFNQELYGRTTSLPWGLEIYERRNANGALDSLNGVSTGQLIEVVHPTFLYELLWNLLVFVLLIWVDRRFRMGHGRLFALYVAAYCFGRFWIELMRSDMATHIAGIRINSFVSVFVFIGAVVYIMVAPKGREDPAELRGYAEDGERAAPGSDSPTEKIEKELVTVAAATGVVAAAKAAGEKEDEDAATEILASDGEEITDSEGEEKSDVEAVAESEQLAEDVSDAPAEEIEEAEAFAEAGEEADATGAIGGVGAVEGDEVTEAEEAAPELHEAAVESAEEAEAIADEVSAEADEAETPVDEDETLEPAADATPVDEVTEAEEAAPESHEAAVESADATEAVADEVSAEADEAETPVDEDETLEPAADEEAAEPETEVGGVGSVESADEAAAVADEASDGEAGDDETPVDEDETEEAAADEEAAEPETADEAAVEKAENAGEAGDQTTAEQDGKERRRIGLGRFRIRRGRD
ncbi:prolipoprotein diacylglyceryl transferase [Mycolicibacterium sp. 120270]|uniref:prolipoprotein diacylglyceryl transferase n=1 Tax=Mycolicibacterium sp. 120270 TaxID=3090600 RepID=UPI00299D55A0|nr:prolipoprotein diacylglyceryl transferase [Mycolicibacterium sp. 120270]MDX1882725.1 prolipoprotein diacylglyceryl transferase [Mycolicibacterium sp. 120270]